MRRARFTSVFVTVGDSRYCAIVRRYPARAAAKVGADHPRFMDPGEPARVQVMRILRDAVDVTDDLTVFIRAKIEDAVRKAAGVAG